MIRNYFVVALRTLWKHKTVTAINMAGWALGSGVVLLIGLFVHHEWTYDTFHEKSDRLVQVVVEGRDEGPGPMALVPGRLPEALAEEAPAVARMTTLKTRTVVASHADRPDQPFEAEALYAGPAFFEMFTFPLVHGRSSTALNRPDGVVLTTEWAQRLLGRTDVLGETVRLRLDDTFETFTVTGVAAPAPSTSSIPLGIVLPVERLQDFDRAFQDPSWRMLSAVLYAELQEPGQAASLERTLQQMAANEMPEEATRAFDVLPITETHLASAIYGQLKPPSDPLYSYILIGIGSFIVLLALINFTTLSLGRSADRGREVGMRKALGAHRRQVAMQFGSEALITTGISLLLGAGAAWLAMPAFEQLVGRSIDAQVLLSGPALGLALAAWMLSAALAGSYPALVLSGFAPIQALRDRATLRHQPRLVSGLVVVQFALAMALVAGTVVMWQQASLLQHKDLGFESSAVVQVDGTLLPPPATDRMRERLHQVVQTDPALQASTGAWGPLAIEQAMPNQFEATSGGQRIQAHAYRAAPGFAETFGIRLRAGRSFARSRPGDAQSAVLINQAFADAMGWDDPVGKTVSVQFNVRDAQVIGVMNDFHYQSLRFPVGPLVVHMRPIAPTPYLFARIAPGQSADALDALQAAWNDVAPDLPFQVAFMDDAIQAQYEAEQQWATIVTYAAGLALFIAVLGLLGLAMLAAARRQREVSIRKVLGASDWSVVAHVTRRFALLVGGAAVLALPVAYVGLQQWLEAFAYRVDVGWGPLAGAAVLVLAVAIATVVSQVMRTTRADPAKVLRAE